MKKILLRILKETGILALMLVILLAVTILTFRNQLPFGKKVPEGQEYVSIDKNEYSVSSTDRLAGINAVTITHETNENQIVNAENDVRIETGKVTPFGNIENKTDLPSERVGISVEVNDEDDEQLYNESGDVLQYPTNIEDENKKEEEEKKEINEKNDFENESDSSLIERRANTND